MAQERLVLPSKFTHRARVFHRVLEAILATVVLGLVAPACIFSQAGLGNLIEHFQSRFFSFAVLVGADDFLQQGLELLPPLPAD